jgi:hypothetical protein
MPKHHHPPAFPTSLDIKGLPWWHQSAVVDEDTGDVVGYILIDTPEDAPDDVQEGLTRRRLAVLSGECPCGARPVLGTRAQRRRAARTGHPLAGAPRVDHRQDCPGHELLLAEAIARWERSGGR